MKKKRRTGGKADRVKPLRGSIVEGMKAAFWGADYGALELPLPPPQEGQIIGTNPDGNGNVFLVRVRGGAVVPDAVAITVEEARAARAADAAARGIPSKR